MVLQISIRRAGRGEAKNIIIYLLFNFYFHCSATKLKLFNRTSQEINNQQASNIEIEIDDIPQTRNNKKKSFPNNEHSNNFAFVQGVLVVRPIKTTSIIN